MPAATATNARSQLVTNAAEANYPLVWWWRCRLPQRRGQRCRITARGGLNSARVEFPDGFWVITSRWAVRRAQ
jgi:hypothetical protein